MPGTGTEQYFAGTQGRVTAGATSGGSPVQVDWHVTEFEMTVESKSADTTTTGDYSSVTGRTWTKRIATTWEASGTFTFFYDKTNPPFGYITSGKVVTVEFYVNDTDKVTGLAYIDSLQIKQGGVQGVIACTCKFTSQKAWVLPGDA